MTEELHEQYKEVPEEMRTTLDKLSTPDAMPASTKTHRGRWIGLGILFILLAVIAGVALGYQRGLAMRISQQESTVLDRVSRQLELAYEDMSNGRYANAKERLTYILQISPGFPGIVELLAEAELQMSQATPLPGEPTPLPVLPTAEPVASPTPDLRGAEEVYNQLVAQIQGQAWSDALITIRTLKENFYDYRTIDVDGWYYLALRNDGVQKINTGRLEEGMYELAMADRLGALDGQADGARYWASVYVTGASYWDTNWQQVLEIFEPLSQQMPYLSDASGMTAKDRYRIALYRIGDDFNSKGDPCTAVSFYQRSLELGEDANVRQTLVAYQQACDLSRQPENTPVPPEVTPEVPTVEAPEGEATAPPPESTP